MPTREPDLKVPPGLRLVDSHCHLDFPDFAGQLPALLQRMQAAGVERALCISVSLAGIPGVLALAQADPRLFATVGVHPDQQDTAEPTVEALVAFARHPRVLAIGETGLDYYRVEGDPQLLCEWQRDRFRVHIRAARASAKPLIVHTRAASQDTLRLLREEGASAVGGIFHCFTEDWSVAEAALDLGFYISFSGIVSFRNADALREVARRVPDDRLLVETDAPYLAPVPYRGKLNEPSFVREVARALATARGIPLEALAELTTQNFDRLFPDAHL